MATFQFSNRALADLESIAAYTIEKWSADQSGRDIAQLQGATQRLVEMPTLGRRCNHIRLGLWRLEVASHVLFSRREGDDILVCRILRYRMLPEYQPIDDST